MPNEEQAQPETDMPAVRFSAWLGDGICIEIGPESNTEVLDDLGGCISVGSGKSSLLVIDSEVLSEVNRIAVASENIEALT